MDVGINVNVNVGYGFAHQTREIKHSKNNKRRIHIDKICMWENESGTFSIKSELSCEQHYTCLKYTLRYCHAQINKTYGWNSLLFYFPWRSLWDFLCLFHCIFSKHAKTVPFLHLMYIHTFIYIWAIFLNALWHCQSIVHMLFVAFNNNKNIAVFDHSLFYCNMSYFHFISSLIRNNPLRYTPVHLFESVVILFVCHIFIY